jgi:predicted nucleotidyltransferase component of viral defense system
MNTSEKSSTGYYKELYRIQDKVLKVIDEIGLNFYLSGGTALGRFFLSHRYSDDLDFLIHNDANFIENIQLIGQHLRVTSRLTSSHHQILFAPG